MELAMMTFKREKEKKKKRAEKSRNNGSFKDEIVWYELSSLIFLFIYPISSLWTRYDTRLIFQVKYFICSPFNHRTSTAQGLFLKWIKTQGCSSHASGKIQKYLRPHRHSPNGGRLRCQETKQQTIGKAIGEVQLVWVQGFLSPRLLNLPKLKNPVCPTIYPWLEGKEMDSCLS